MKSDKEVVREIIEEISGLAFINSKPYSNKTKVFFNNRYLDILKLIPKIKSTKSIGLEVGLAGGILAFLLKKRYSLNKLYAIEHPVASKKYTKVFLDKLKKNSIILESVDLHKDKLPWPDNFFNYVVFSEVVEHLIPSDIPNVIKEINRVVKKNGWVFITTPNVASLLKRINLLFGKNPIEFDLFLHEGATYGHIREYTMDELLTIVKAGGFNVENNYYFMIDSNRNMFTKIESISSKFYPPFGNNLAVIVTK